MNDDIATMAVPLNVPPRRPPVGRAEQIEEYVDLLLELDRQHPSGELHDRIERALEALHQERKATEVRMVAYDIPLRPGAPLVRVTLPMDLTVAEADRLAGIIRAIAFGEKADA